MGLNLLKPVIDTKWTEQHSCWCPMTNSHYFLLNFTQKCFMLMEGYKCEHSHSLFSQCVCVCVFSYCLLLADKKIVHFPSGFLRSTTLVPKTCHLHPHPVP